MAAPDPSGRGRGLHGTRPEYANVGFEATGRLRAAKEKERHGRARGSGTVGRDGVFAHQESGGRGGCTTCGTRDLVTASGQWIRSHVPPTSLRMPGEPQYRGPHCQNRSNKQGGWTRQMLLRIKEAFDDSDPPVQQHGAVGA